MGKGVWGVEFVLAQQASIFHRAVVGALGAGVWRPTVGFGALGAGVWRPAVGFGALGAGFGARQWVRCSGCGGLAPGRGLLVTSFGTYLPAQIRHVHSGRGLEWRSSNLVQGC